MVWLDVLWPHILNWKIKKKKKNWTEVIFCWSATVSWYPPIHLSVMAWGGGSCRTKPDQSPARPQTTILRSHSLTDLRSVLSNLPSECRLSDCGRSFWPSGDLNPGPSGWKATTTTHIWTQDVEFGPLPTNHQTHSWQQICQIEKKTWGERLCQRAPSRQNPSVILLVTLPHGEPCSALTRPQREHDKQNGREFHS